MCSLGLAERSTARMWLLLFRWMASLNSVSSWWRFVVKVMAVLVTFGPESLSYYRAWAGRSCSAHWSAWLSSGSLLSLFCVIFLKSLLTWCVDTARSSRLRNFVVRVLQWLSRTLWWILLGSKFFGGSLKMVRSWDVSLAACKIARAKTALN